MAALTLGLDLGPTSIGWALLDENAKDDIKLIACGVRVFPEGVDRDTKGAEISKNAQRRLARAQRRQTRRRAARKRQLRQLLVQAGLLPQCALNAVNDPERVQWESEAFQSADPYELRARALQSRLELFEIGRVLVHLNQRRGFRSNRKADRERAKETEGMLAEINELQKEIDETNSHTLGNLLANKRPDSPKHFHQVRLRGRHTRRDMYEHEFAAIWEAQSRYHPELLTEELREQLHKTIFFQRELLPPSPGLIGRCELIPRLPRCFRADRRFQRFRMLNEVNNLRVIDMSQRKERSLDDSERDALIQWLSRKKDATFQAIRRKLFDQHENFRFNLESAGRTKMHGIPVDAALSKKDFIGKKWWDVEERLKNWIVAAIIDDDEHRLRTLLRQADLDDDLAPLLLDRVPLESGYGSYSTSAIKRMLPHVERGLPLLSRDASVPCAYREAGFLPPWERTGETVTRLGRPPEVTNPIVNQALHELRKVVNGIVREYLEPEGHSLETIRIELAREARGTARHREKYIKDNIANRRRREEAVEWLKQYGAKPTRDAIERYLLWKEQGEICAYSEGGRPISPEQLLSGGEVEVDHILPYPRSLDNSRMNKVVCFGSENNRGSNINAKGDRTPYEWLAESDPKKYEEVLQRARSLPYPKMRRFYQRELDADFVNRQLRDTSYITTQVRNYVQQLGADVECVKGQHTAALRHRWGLQSVLSELEDSPAWQQAQDLPPGEKNRLDHRHHAVDAIVVALSDRSRLQNLATVFHNDNARRFGAASDERAVLRAEKKLREPGAGFRAQVLQAISRINVSYRVRRKVSGPLHEDTIYGPTDRPGVGVVRKELSALSPSMVDNIRDTVVRDVVLSRLREHGIEPGRGKDSIPATVWKEPLWMNKEKGIAIKRVRVIRRDATIQPIRSGTAYIKPGNTHHVCLFEVTDADGKTKKVAHFVTLLEAMRRIRRREPVIQKVHPELPEARFLMSLSANELVLLEHNGKEGLYRFEKAASTSGQMHFRQHCAGGKSADKIGQISKKPNTFNGRKVTVDPLGRIRWAND